MKKILILFALFNLTAFSQDEFLVNTFQDTTQRAPVIAADGLGNYAIVWQSKNQVSANSDFDIYMQLFDQNDQKIGGEILVNQTTAGIQEHPAIAMNSTGRIVITWASYTDEVSIYDIKARIFQMENPTANEFTVNDFTLNSQSNPDVDINSNGHFVIVWDSWNEDGGDRGVYSVRYDENMNVITSHYLVNQTTAYSQAKPKIKYFNNGNWIVVWESFKQDGSGYGVYGRIFKNDNSSAGDEFQINSFTQDYQWFADIEIFDDDSFAAAWCSWEQDGWDGGIYFQRFDNSGIKTGDEKKVNKNIAEYQWLPKVKKLSGTKFAVVWSSWKQDGNREGIYTAFVNEEDEVYTLETPVNQYTQSYQWEPDFIVINDNEILATWASWEQFGEDYDIIARRVSPKSEVGILDQNNYQHFAGNSTASFVVHVVDSIALTGHTYQITFDTTTSGTQLFATITDQTNSQIKVDDYPLNNGLGFLYQTNIFDGIAVEFKPQYTLELDPDNSYLVNSSGTNVLFEVFPPSLGQRLLAPIDVALVWGNTDTLSDGSYSAPLDTALSSTGQKKVVVPFKGINLVDNSELTLLVKENAATNNNMWDIGEEIMFITPEPYRQTPFNTHAQLNSSAAENIIMPGEGDTNYVLTKRPLTPEDVYTFIADPLDITGINESILPNSFELFQNYPNPFNPVTTIKYSIPYDGKINIKIFNILGEEVSQILNEIKSKGTYRLQFNGNGLASGVYIYSINFDNKIISKKMILLK